MEILQHSKQVTEYFDLGDLIEISPLPSGYANKNYRLDTSRGTFLLRHCLQQTLELLHYEIELMQLLASFQFPTAYPMAGKDHHFIATIDRQHYMVYDFLHGREPDLNRYTVAAIGKAVGLLSTVSPIEQFANKKNTLHLDHINQLIIRFPRARNQRPDIFRFIEHYAGSFNRLETTGLPKGIIHGDLFPNNTLFNDSDRLLGIVDFEEACVDHLLLDVGMTINGFCFVNNRLEENFFNLFLANYQEYRPLQKIEINLLIPFIGLAAFCMMCWHMRFNLIDQHNPQQEARVRELMSRVQDLDSGTFNKNVLRNFR